MRLLLGAHRPRLALGRVEQACLLIDFAAILEDRDLAARLGLDRLPDEPDRVDVLDLAAGAERLAGAAHRDVHVGAERPLLHVAVAGAEIAQDRAQLGDVGLRLLRRAQVRPGDDLHQRHARAVEIDEAAGGVLVVQGLAGILLQVQPLDADGDRGAVGHVDQHLALADDRILVLRDLVALRQIRVEVVLPVEHRAQVDLRLEAEAGAHRLGDAFGVDHRQHAGHRGIDQRDVVVRLGAELGGGAGEQLRLARHLGVDLHADDHLPIVEAALDQLLGVDGCVHGRPGRESGLAKSSHPRPHPEVLHSSLEGGLQGSRGWLAASFEASAALRHLRMRSRRGSISCGHLRAAAQKDQARRRIAFRAP